MNIDFGDAGDFLKSCEDVLIITHQNPDGDCIGAGFALKDILESFGTRSRVVCSDEFPKRFDFLTKTGCGEEFEPKTVITVDLADPQLMGSLREKYENRVQLCIDHHVSNTGYAERTLLRADASAACEVIYDLACDMGIDISDHAAACLYTGIATDTGCFKYECTTIRAHLIAAEIMMRRSINFAYINRQMFDVKTAGRIKLESALMEGMEYYFDGKLTMISVTAQLLERTGAEMNDLDGCASMPLQVETALVGVLIKEREPGVYRISMRSAGGSSINVSEICRTFGGGGHSRAAGCVIKGSLDEVKKLLSEAIGKVLQYE